MNEHYKQNEMDPLTAFRGGLISRDEFIGFCKGNVVKYVCRFQFKGGEEDLLKCLDYVLELLMFCTEEEFGGVV